MPAYEDLLAIPGLEDGGSLLPGNLGTGGGGAEIYVIAKLSR